MKSISGTQFVAANYGTNAATTANAYTVERFGLREVMFLITNTVKSIAPGVTLPEEVALAVDFFNTNLVEYTFVGSNILGAYTNQYTLNTRNVYLTNHLGFYFSLTDSNVNLASFSISDIATKFKDDLNTNGSERDVILANLNFHNLQDQNGKLHEITIAGAGILDVFLNTNDAATITLSVKGAGVGGPQESETALGEPLIGGGVLGICTGSFTFGGSGIPPTDGLPYSVYWWNNLRLIPQPLPVQIPITNFPPPIIITNLPPTIIITNIGPPIIINTNFLPPGFSTNPPPIIILPDPTLLMDSQ